jgi:hypothetical protein
MCSERREYKFPVQIDDQFDKAVTVIGYRSGNYLWHECQTCGRNKPRTGYLNAQGQIQAIPTHVAVADHRCPICGVDGVLIGIKIRNPVKGKPRTVCGGPCLNGQRSCDCRCYGRCHGAGTCQCGT